MSNVDLGLHEKKRAVVWPSASAAWVTVAGVAVAIAATLTFSSHKRTETPQNAPAAIPEQPVSHKTLAHRVDEPSPRKAETEEQQQARIQAELEATFQADGPISDHTRRIEEILRGAFQVEGSDATSIECRASTCRLEVTFDNPETSERILRKVFLSGDYADLGRLAVSVTNRSQDAESRMRVRIYLYDDRAEPPAQGQ